MALKGFTTLSPGTCPIKTVVSKITRYILKARPLRMTRSFGRKLPNF
jgi:hypothetical protein